MNDTERIDQLYDCFNKLTIAMSQMVARIKALEEKTVKPSRTRNPTTLETYYKVQDMVASGMDYKDVARELDIPATTCAGYLNANRWTPEYIEKKRLEESLREKGKV